MFSSAFIDAIAPLRNPAMGTEHVATLLYSMIRMTRPRSVLEIGMGYTTAFILQALADNVREYESDKALLQNGDASDERRTLLRPDFYIEPYQPTLIAIDDFSQDYSSAPRVMEIADRLQISPYLHTIQGDFKGTSALIAPALLPVDFVWFDCGGSENSRDFFAEYWPHINPEGGHVLMHFTHRWQISQTRQNPGVNMLDTLRGDVLRDIVAQPAYKAGEIEISSLIEPHKWWQGSVSHIRRVSPRETQAVLPESQSGVYLPTTH